MRAHVTEELIKVVKVQHKKHPAMTQKELAERIGCSAATVGRILAGKYDKKVDVDEVIKNIRTDIYVDKYGDPYYVDEHGNPHPAIPNGKPEKGQKDLTADTYDPKTGRFDTGTDKDEDAKTLAKAMENQQRASGETVFKIDTSNVAMAEVLKTVIDILAGTPKPSMPAAPIPDERFKYEVLTELKAIKEIEADTYKELKQLKGILAEIRDIWKK